MDFSAFALLPGEIRNSIYEMVLEQPNGIPVYTGKEAIAPRGDGKDLERLVPAISGLPSTSRAIRAETMKLYFSLNPLVVYCAREGGLERAILQTIRELAQWCQIVGRQHTSELRKVVFDLRYQGWMINMGLSVLQQYAPKLRQFFHPSVQFEVKCRAPYWDITGLSLPVAIVLGDRTASLERLNVVAGQTFDRLHKAGSGQGSDQWNELKDCERRVREAIERMPETQTSRSPTRR